MMFCRGCGNVIAGSATSTNVGPYYCARCASGPVISWIKSYDDAQEQIAAWEEEVRGLRRWKEAWEPVIEAARQVLRSNEECEKNMVENEINDWDPCWDKVFEMLEAVREAEAER